MRLRTLPLSLSGIIAGMALAAGAGRIGLFTAITLVCNTILLQILSNLSNELGDTLHGTDTADRMGIHYSIQDGEMTVPEMKRIIAAVALLCCGCGLLMILASFGTLFAPLPLLFIGLGACAVWAAMHYTLGDNPYGYRGLGDLSVFIFFGLVSVLGAAFICVHEFEPVWVLPAAAIGCFSIGVLNVNNIRDMKTDAVNRTTVAIRLGARRARIYQTVLISLGWLLMLAYALISRSPLAGYLHFITLPLFLLHLRGVWTKQDRGLDPMLPMLVMSMFAMSLLFAAGNII